MHFHQYPHTAKIDFASWGYLYNVMLITSSVVPQQKRN